MENFIDAKRHSDLFRSVERGAFIVVIAAEQIEIIPGASAVRMVEPTVNVGDDLFVFHKALEKFGCKDIASALPALSVKIIPERVHSALSVQQQVVAGAAFQMLDPHLPSNKEINPRWCFVAFFPTTLFDSLLGVVSRPNPAVVVGALAVHVAVRGQKERMMHSDRDLDHTLIAKAAG